MRLESGLLATFRLGLMLLAIGIIGTTAVQAQAVFSAGAAKTKITPQGPEWLAGYDNNRRSEGVHDDLWARALVLKSGDQFLSIVSVDLIGFPGTCLDRVRQTVKSVPAASILISATHGHSSPDVIGLWGPSQTESGVDQTYVDTVIKAVAQIIDEAAGSVKPATMRCAAADLPGVSKNIRVAEILDTGLSALQAVGDDGKAIATLVNFACHPAIMNNKSVTADFCNWLYQRIEGQAGGVALFVNGAQGGMITANLDAATLTTSSDSWDDAARIGNAIADKALEALAKAGPVQNPAMTMRTSALRVPIANPGFEAAFKAGVLPDVRRDGALSVEVLAGSIGRAEFVTIPGEAFPSIGLALKGWMSGDPKFIFGITQDELGYIMPRADYGTALYEYETSMSAGPDVGDLLVQTLRPMIEATNASLPSDTASAASSLDAWFLGLPDSFNAAAAGDTRAVYYFKVTGPGGGDYTVTVAEGKCKAEKRKPERADLTMTVSAPDAALITSHQLDPMNAWTSGKIAFDGDTNLAMKFAQLFGL